MSEQYESPSIQILSLLKQREGNIILWQLDLQNDRCSQFTQAEPYLGTC